MKWTLWVLFMLILLAGGVYIFISKPTQAPAPLSNSTATTSSAQVQEPAAVVQKPSPNQGATGVYDPTAPQGSPAECAQCDQYSSAQKAQCLAALHC